MRLIALVAASAIVSIQLPAQTVCAASNPNTTAHASIQQNPNFFAMSVPAHTSARTVTGFELFTQTRGRTTPLVIKTWIYLADSLGRPTGSPLGESRMTVGTSRGWYRTTLGGPVVIPANTRFALSWQPVDGQMWLPIAKLGGFARHFFRRPSSTTWAGPYGTQKWAWRVLCDGPTGNVFDSLVDSVMNFGAGNVGIRFTGPSKVAQAPLRFLANQHLRIDAEIVSACLDLQHGTLGPLQFRLGRALGLPATTGAYVSNQPRVLFPATGTFGFRYSIHGRDFDLCPDQGARGMVNRTVTALPPTNDFTPAATQVTTFTDACTGIRSTTRMTALTRYRPLGVPKAAPPALHRTTRTTTIAGNASGNGFARLTLRIAPGEPHAGALIASSGSVAVTTRQSCGVTASRLGNALGANLARTRPCCPFQVTVRGCAIEVGTTSLRRFVCYLEGTSINSPPFGKALGVATNLGQRFTKGGTREWVAWGDTPPAAKITIYGAPTPEAQNPGLHMVSFGVPQANNTIHLGVSTTRGRARLPHALFIGAAPANVTVGGLTILVAPTPGLFLPLPPARGGVVTTPLPFPAIAPIRLYIQGFALDLSAPLGLVGSDAMDMTTG